MLCLLSIYIIFVANFRAITHFSGGIIEKTLIPNMQTKQLDEGTLYKMISQVLYYRYRYQYRNRNHNHII